MAPLLCGSLKAIDVELAADLAIHFEFLARAAGFDRLPARLEQELHHVACPPAARASG
jgi:hypothetical protein